VRVGDHVYVSGTAPIGAEGGNVAVGDVSTQARRCLEIISAALSEAGASLDDVVRTRIFLIDVANWEEVAAVHGEYFAGVRPASTVVQVSRFIDPEWLVEIEADAVVGTDEEALLG
jgi:enamine deaminase RidA (YjgF/YER057c/UK114 family)